MSTYQVVSKLTTYNELGLTFYDEETHEPNTYYGFPIKTEKDLGQALAFIESLTREEVPRVTREDYLCPIPHFHDILQHEPRHVKLEFLDITLSNGGETDLLLYSLEKPYLSMREIQDIKHILYEDYKLSVRYRNILFRFETDEDIFYIKMNSTYTDLSVDIINEEYNMVKFDFSILVKEGSNHPFEKVNFITTIDSRRASSFSIKNVSLVETSPQADQSVVKLTYLGELMTPLNELEPVT